MAPIARGAQNLPGNWESQPLQSSAHSIPRASAKIGDHETMVVMHNDAVVQGLSQLPHIRRSASTGAVLTIGTGLGNARFTNRKVKKPKDDKKSKDEKT